MEQETVFLWHKDSDLQQVDCVVYPAAFPTGIICAREPLPASPLSMAEIKNLPRPAGWFWAFATVFRFCWKPAFCPGPC